MKSPRLAAPALFSGFTHAYMQQCMSILELARGTQDGKVVLYAMEDKCFPAAHVTCGT